ncbi:MAG: class I SAM-dependent methyltransferase [Thermodesulfobacteriota bacterium]
MWKRITRTCTKDIVKKTFVEFGCGPGRFLDVIRSRGGRAVGLELTQAADAARENFAADPDVLIVQADIFHPPFKPGVFDGGYSIGVLHHTPDPPKGLMELAKTIRSGGWTAISVYSKEGLYGFRSVENFRRLHLWLKPILGYRFALAYSYFSAYLLAPLLNMARTLPHLGLRRFIDFLLQNWIVALAGLPDRHWRLLDTFDAITPAIATAHTGEEVRQWMQAAGFIEISPTEWGDTSFKGVKP